MRRIIIMIATGAVLGLVLAHPAGAIPVLDYKIAKKADGPYDYFGVKFNNIDVGDSKNVYLKVKSNAPDPASATFIQDTNAGGYKLKFFKGAKNITSQVEPPGYEFLAQPDRVKRFRVNIKRTGQLADVCIEIPLWDEAPSAQFRFVANGIEPEDCI